MGQFSSEGRQASSDTRQRAAPTDDGVSMLLRERRGSGSGTSNTGQSVLGSQSLERDPVCLELRPRGGGIGVAGAGVSQSGRMSLALHVFEKL